MAIIFHHYCVDEATWLSTFLSAFITLTMLTLHRFDIIKKLGQGTYGKVQLGINKETGQEVAIKTIKKSKIETEADLIRIRREVQIMSSVQHPNIIHIYEGEWWVWGRGGNLPAIECNSISDWKYHLKTIKMVHSTSFQGLFECNSI